MIKISLHYNNQKDLWRFTLDGHADYDHHGQDIVCAAVSMLVLNTINSIELLTEEAIRYEQDEKTGYIDCTFSDIKDNQGSSEATLLLKSMVLGLREIKQEYKDYIQIFINKNSSGGE